jgi:hypothetical protein
MEETIEETLTFFRRSGGVAGFAWLCPSRRYAVAAAYPLGRRWPSVAPRCDLESFTIRTSAETDRVRHVRGFGWRVQAHPFMLGGRPPARL